jgi:hypothetical protein
MSILGVASLSTRAKPPQRPRPGLIRHRRGASLSATPTDVALLIEMEIDSDKFASKRKAELDADDRIHSQNGADMAEAQVVPAVAMDVAESAGVMQLPPRTAVRPETRKNSDASGDESSRSSLYSAVSLPHVDFQDSHETDRKSRRRSSDSSAFSSPLRHDRGRRQSPFRRRTALKSEMAQTPSRLLNPRGVMTFLKLFDAIADYLAAFYKQEASPFKAAVDWKGYKARLNNMLLRILGWKNEFDGGDLSALLAGTSSMEESGEQAVKPLLLSIGEKFLDLVEYEMVKVRMIKRLQLAAEHLEECVREGKEVQDHSRKEDASSVASNNTLESGPGAVNAIDQQLDDLDNDLDLLINMGMPDLLKRSRSRRKSRRARSQRKASPQPRPTVLPRPRPSSFTPSALPHPQYALQSGAASQFEFAPSLSPDIQHMAFDAGHRLTHQPYIDHRGHEPYWLQVPSPHALGQNRSDYFSTPTTPTAGPFHPSPFVHLRFPGETTGSRPPFPMQEVREFQYAPRPALDADATRVVVPRASRWDRAVVRRLEHLQRHWTRARQPPDLERQLQGDEPMQLTLLISSNPVAFQEDSFKASLESFEQSQKERAESDPIDSLTARFSDFQIRPVNNKVCTDIVETLREAVPKVRHAISFEGSLRKVVESVDFTAAVVGALPRWLLYTNFPDGNQLTKALGASVQTILLDEFFFSCVNLVRHLEKRQPVSRYSGREFKSTYSGNPYLVKLVRRRVQGLLSLSISRPLVSAWSAVRPLLRELDRNLQEFDVGDGSDSETETEARTSPRTTSVASQRHSPSRRLESTPSWHGVLRTGRAQSLNDRFSPIPLGEDRQRVRFPPVSLDEDRYRKLATAPSIPLPRETPTPSSRYPRPPSPAFRLERLSSPLPHSRQVVPHYRELPFNPAITPLPPRPISSFAEHRYYYDMEMERPTSALNGDIIGITTPVEVPGPAMLPPVHLLCYAARASDGKVTPEQGDAAAKTDSMDTEMNEELKSSIRIIPIGKEFLGFSSD